MRKEDLLKILEGYSESEDVNLDDLQVDIADKVSVNFEEEFAELANEMEDVINVKLSKSGYFDLKDEHYEIRLIKDNMGNVHFGGHLAVTKYYSDYKLNLCAAMCCYASDGDWDADNYGELRDIVDDAPEWESQELLEDLKLFILKIKGMV